MLFSPEQEQLVGEAIAQAEMRTSGEIRLYVESFCERDHPVERAEELFNLHGMFHTRERNAVLIYVAYDSRVFAIWGDSGIHEKVGMQFWENEKKLLRSYLQRDEAAAGICAVIQQIGDQLARFFPVDPSNDNPNELPNEIIYG